MWDLLEQNWIKNIQNYDIKFNSIIKSVGCISLLSIWNLYKPVYNSKIKHEKNMGLAEQNWIKCEQNYDVEADSKIQYGEVTFFSLWFETVVTINDYDDIIFKPQLGGRKETRSGRADFWCECWKILY